MYYNKIDYKRLRDCSKTCPYAIRYRQMHSYLVHAIWLAQKSFKCHLEAIELHKNIRSHLGILTVQKEQMCSPAPEHIDKLHSSRRHYGTKHYFQFYKKLQVLTVITGVRRCIYCNQKYCTVAPILHITASGAWLECPTCLLRVYSTMRSGFRRRISLPPPPTQLNSSFEVLSSIICFLGPSKKSI